MLSTQMCHLNEVECLISPGATYFHVHSQNCRYWANASVITYFRSSLIYLDLIGKHVRLFPILILLFKAEIKSAIS